jgi:hypothetical protein
MNIALFVLLVVLGANVTVTLEIVDRDYLRGLCVT